MSSDSSGNTDEIQYSTETETYRTQFDETDLLPSRAVIRALSKVSMTDPGDFEPLHTSIDPEALDQLCTNPIQREGDRMVEFSHLGYQITVKSYGVIELQHE